jgi:thiaminase
MASTDLLDTSCTAADQAATSDDFGRSVRYEIAFWRMAYTRGESDRVVSA